MHSRQREEAQTWGLWVLLLAGTTLASVWLREPGDDDGSHPDLPGSDTSETVAPPRIVFPAIEDDER
jgi:hypothetical protein